MSTIRSKYLLLKSNKIRECYYIYENKSSSCNFNFMKIDTSVNDTVFIYSRMNFDPQADQRTTGFRASI